MIYRVKLQNFSAGLNCFSQAVPLGFKKYFSAGFTFYLGKENQCVRNGFKNKKNRIERNGDIEDGFDNLT